MGNFLRVSVILTLVLSIAAAVLEFTLFQKREELKARSILLGHSVAQLTATIEAPTGTVSDLVAKDSPHLQVTEDQLKQFYKLDAMGHPEKDASGKKIVALESLLNDIAGRAAVQYSRLNDTRDELGSTRQDLTKTQGTLKETEDNLTDAKKDVEQKANTIAQQTTTIGEQNDKITTLEGDKEKLESKVETQTTQITKLSDNVTKKQQEIDATKRYVDQLQHDLDICRGGGGEGTNAVSRGIQGEVLLVSTNWNFVVLDVLPSGQLFPKTDLTVQRDSKLVGKVRVSAILQSRRFAIAEILPDWEQMPIESGDYVFY